MPIDFPGACEQFPGEFPEIFREAASRRRLTGGDPGCRKWGFSVELPASREGALCEIPRTEEKSTGCFPGRRIAANLSGGSRIAAGGYRHSRKASSGLPVAPPGEFPGKLHGCEKFAGEVWPIWPNSALPWMRGWPFSGYSAIRAKRWAFFLCRQMGSYW